MLAERRIATTEIGTYGKERQKGSLSVKNVSQVLIAGRKMIETELP